MGLEESVLQLVQENEQTQFSTEVDLIPDVAHVVSS